MKPSELGRRLADRLARRAGYDLVRRDFYSPVPDVDDLQESDWARRSELHGISLDTEHQMAFAERELAEWIAAFPGAMKGTRFRLWNSYFESVDAEILYALLRMLRPSRVVELGSGHSTLVIDRALEHNGSGSRISFDPFAGAIVAGLPRVEPVPAQEVPIEELLGLASGDVLFVDTSHTVKLGGEVSRIVLEVLPQLVPGVVVHFHDIWLPWEYHRVLVEAMQQYWNEQYLLQGFLAENPHWEIVFAAQAVARAHPERLSRLVPTYERRNYPTSFWLRRLSAPD